MSNNSQGRTRHFTLASEALSADRSINFLEFKKFAESVFDTLVKNLGKNSSIRKYKFEGASTKQRKLCPVSNYLLGNHSDFVSVLPIQATSDGNCLFNSVSRLLYGMEGFATELRMRAVFDMIFNFDSYLCAANYPSEEIFHFCFSTTRDTIGETSEDTLFNEIKRISKIGEWSGMLMMVALTNSLNISIQQIYPKVESTKNPLYDYSNSRLEPFEKESKRKFYFLFSTST